MILIQRGETANVIVTATEKAVLTPTRFTITFTHDLTKDTVVYVDAQDVSPSPERYNEFVLNLQDFDDLDNGFYSYEVRDQENNLLEAGKMKLEGVKTSPVQYQDTPINYKTYGE